MYKRIITIAISTFFISCNPSSEGFQEIDIFSEFIDQRELTSDKKYDGIFIGNPLNYLEYDSLLFILESGQDNFIRCVDIKNEKEIAFFLSKGRGPSELLHCLSIRSYGKDSIQLYGEHRKILQFAAKDILYDEPIKFETFSFPDSLAIRPNAVKIDDYTALFSGTPLSQREDKYFCMYDLKTGKYIPFGNYNEEWFNTMELKSTSKNLIAQAIIQPHPEKRLFVSVTPNFKSIEIYDLDILEKVAGRYYELPGIEDLSVEGLNIVLSSEDKIGFTDVDCDSENIYCFYMEKTPKDIDNGKMYVFVYDWELNPKKCYIMEAYRARGMISSDKNYIYTVKQDEKGDFVLIRYSL